MNQKQNVPVAQESAMGCSVACVAFVCCMPFKQALRLFKDPQRVGSKGAGCMEICAALKKQGRSYTWKKINSMRDPLLKRKGAIIYAAPTLKETGDHYVVFVGKRKYMNPWINFPNMNPVQAGFAQKIPGKPTYVMYPNQ
ncbi:hypothetical protein HZB02_06825 [Candidatus Woesearchaeota archaeon]|nr:hypothetical protein [Candidatus Woesearchaeota archaeon]